MLIATRQYDSRHQNLRRQPRRIRVLSAHLCRSGGGPRTTHPSPISRVLSLSPSHTSIVLSESHRSPLSAFPALASDGRARLRGPRRNSLAPPPSDSDRHKTSAQARTRAGTRPSDPAPGPFKHPLSPNAQLPPSLPACLSLSVQHPPSPNAPFGRPGRADRTTRTSGRRPARPPAHTLMQQRARSYTCAGAQLSLRHHRVSRAGPASFPPPPRVRARLTSPPRFSVRNPF